MGDINNCPKLSFEQFYAIPNGTRVFNHGADQCVALANQYHEGTIGGSFVPVASAFQWWDNFGNYPTLTGNYTKHTDSPQQGDIFIGRYGIYDAPNGHIGVVSRTWDGSTFGTMEQNAGTGSARWTWRYNRNMSNILGFLRPNQIQPPQPTQEETEMYAKVQYADGWAGLWNMATGQVSWIGSDSDYRQFNSNLKTYVFQDAADFDNFRNRYPFLLPKTDLSSVQINVDALAQAIANKLGGGTSPDVTTKQDILTAIESNYPENL